MKFSYCHHRHSKPDPNSPALDIKGLDVAYANDEKIALASINLSIPAGTSIALVGPNGAGKSTLFKAISGLLPIHSGNIKVFGHSLGACHHRVVYLPQRSEIDWQFPMSVLELVTTGRYVYLGWFASASQKDINIARHALDEMGVLDLADRQISKLSGGQQQRVLIARALAQQADLLLLDEPLNAVDVATRQIVAEVLGKIKAQGKTVFVVHYDLNTVDRYFDWVILLNTCLIAAGPVSNVFHADNVMRTYGKSTTLLDEAAKLSQSKSSGLPIK